MATRQHLDIAGRDDGATKKSIGAAGLGGASTGTGLVGLGQLIGSHTLVGEILIYVAPVFSVISGLLLSQLGYMVKIWVDRYNENSVVKKARGTLEGQLADPNLSEGSCSAMT
jgi:hypothetical protein